jgi:hypothetical protein
LTPANVATKIGKGLDHLRQPDSAFVSRETDERRPRWSFCRETGVSILSFFGHFLQISSLENMPSMENQNAEKMDHYLQNSRKVSGPENSEPEFFFDPEIAEIFFRKKKKKKKNPRKEKKNLFHFTDI